MDYLTQCILKIVENLPAAWATFFLASIPVTELRAAIPIALAWGLSPTRTFAAAILGNILPIIPILLLLGPVSRSLIRFKVFRLFFKWLFTKTKRHEKKIQKYGFWGLALFVGIPLPGTGVWTGCVLAFLLGIRLIPAFVAMSLGVLVAGILVMGISLGLFELAGNIGNSGAFWLVLIPLIGIWWFFRNKHRQRGV
ncbi:MAG TPA: small multi-drug export protein [Clostridia bacterium]|nr:small multi-drug export protein [Clostridia bacterium]